MVKLKIEKKDCLVNIWVHIQSQQLWEKSDPQISYTMYDTEITHAHILKFEAWFWACFNN